MDGDQVTRSGQGASARTIGWDRRGLPAWAYGNAELLELEQELLFRRQPFRLHLNQRIHRPHQLIPQTPPRRSATTAHRCARLSPPLPDMQVVIIGGGINGCGIARDLAGRGWRVTLVEADDLASHTSSSSTKLIHGGLRYLEY